jgi:Asparagine synthase
MDIREASINSFISFGYFLDYERDDFPIDFSKIDHAPYAALPEQELVRIGTEKLRESFRLQFETGRDHVVPLSGGLDSRLIVAALRELTEARNIQTVTFGVPGTYDYDIGVLVGKHAGTRQSALPVNCFSYHEDELLDRARRMHGQVIVFHCPPLWHFDRLFGKSLIWSGYVGDAVAGSHLREQPSATQDEAKRRYLARRRLIRSMRLDRASDDEFLPHLTTTNLPPSTLTHDEQLLFAEGVRKFTAPTVLLDGFQYRTPFINTPWMDFMFSVPAEYRLEERLLIKIGQSAFPDLFGLPTKMTYGAKLGSRPELALAKRVVNKARKAVRRYVPAINYGPILYDDFDERYRDSPGLIELARRNLADLAARGVVDWLDLNDIWRRHQSRRGNFADALNALVSLELVLKTKTN